MWRVTLRRVFRNRWGRVLTMLLLLLLGCGLFCMGRWEKLFRLWVRLLNRMRLLRRLFVMFLTLVVGVRRRMCSWRIPWLTCGWVRWIFVIMRVIGRWRIRMRRLLMVLLLVIPLSVLVVVTRNRWVLDWLFTLLAVWCRLRMSRSRVWFVLIRVVVRLVRLLLRKSIRLPLTWRGRGVTRRCVILVRVRVRLCR